MVKNWRVEKKNLVCSWQLKCMDAKRNLHGRTTEFAWMHNKVCMDAQQNLHGRTTEFAWMHDGIGMDKQRNLLEHITFSFWGKIIHIHIFFVFLLCCCCLNVMDLGHNQQQHPTVQSGGVSRGRSPAPPLPLTFRSPSAPLSLPFRSPFATLPLLFRSPFAPLPLPFRNPPPTKKKKS